MTETLVPTTELQAVNNMLASIGESPVSTLDTGTVVDADLAQTLLFNVNRQVQALGLHCNSEVDYPLSPNEDGEIILPANTLRVDEVYGASSRDLTQRGSRLYDRNNRTFVIDESVTLDIVMMLPFDELPEAVRWYIAVKASRIFVDKTMGDEALHAYSRQDEMEAKRDFVKSQLKNRDASMLNSTFARSITGRQRVTRR